MSFRKTKTVFREAIGSYVNGVWTAGARSVVTIQASVQPVSGAQDLQALPEGRHFSDFIKIYTTSRLYVTADGEFTQPDLIVHEGYCYELIDMAANRSGVLNHYKFTGAKVCKYTTDADWTNGTTKRP